MAFTSSPVALRECSRTYRRFAFQGVRELAYCHLKIDIHNAMPVFLCSAIVGCDEQTLKRGFSDIKRRTIVTLYDEKIAVPTRRAGCLSRLSPRWFEERQRRDIVEFFDRSSLWIRYVSPFVSMWGSDIYELLHASGLYMTPLLRDEVARLTGLQPSFFDVSFKELGLARS